MVNWEQNWEYGSENTSFCNGIFLYKKKIISTEMVWSVKWINSAWEISFQLSCFDWNRLKYSLSFSKSYSYKFAFWYLYFLNSFPLHFQVEINCDVPFHQMLSVSYQRLFIWSTQQLSLAVLHKIAAARVQQKSCSQHQLLPLAHLSEFEHSLRSEIPHLLLFSKGR